MAEIVFIVGRSGTGKSYSLKELDPTTSLIINADQKHLPFQYKTDWSAEKKNYTRTSDIAEWMKLLHYANSKDGEHIQTVVIDTLTREITDYTLSSGFRKKDGWGKWDDFAGQIYDLLQYIYNDLRDDCMVFIMSHPDLYDDELLGTQRERVAVRGGLLKSYPPESFSSIVLYAHVKPPKIAGKAPTYHFSTVNSGYNSAKTPPGMFPDTFIDNNIVDIEASVRNYYLEKPILNGKQ